MSDRSRRCVAVTVALAAAGFTEEGSTTPVVIEGARIHPITSPAIEVGTIVFDGDTITHVGAAADVPVPEDAIRIDGRGFDVWPGMIDVETVLGLVEVSSVRGTRDYAESGRINASVRAITAVNPASELIPVTRANGVLLAGVVPRSGLVSGMASAMALDGWTWEEMVRTHEAGLVIRWPDMRASRDPDPDTPRKWQRDIATLTELFEEASVYGDARALSASDRPADVEWEALLRVVRGAVPVWIVAAREAQIRAALAWTERVGVRMVLIDDGDAWRCADALAARDVPVATRTIRLPVRTYEPYDVRFRAPAVLHAAGVRLAFRTSSASNVRNLPHEAARAVAYGLPRAAAERALTLEAARLLGVDDAYGSLEAGKRAALLLVEGDLLDTRMQVRRAWLDGRELDLSTRHTRLWERYRGR